MLVNEQNDPEAYKSFFDDISIIIDKWKTKNLIQGVITHDQNVKTDNFQDFDDWIKLPRNAGNKKCTLQTFFK